MSSGDQADFVARLKGVIPNGWFPDSTPVLDAILNGLAYCLSFIYSLNSYAKLQTRIATAVDGFLDLVAFDYFGNLLGRRTNENDTSLRARIFQNLLRQKATRAGMIKLLTDLTGKAPIVTEPWRPLDCGAWDAGICGWDVAGRWGDTNLPYQAFIIAYRPSGQGVPYLTGWDVSYGGYDTGGLVAYTDPSQIAGAVTDADIYAAIADAKVEGTIAWTQIVDP